MAGALRKSKFVRVDPYFLDCHCRQFHTDLPAGLEGYITEKDYELAIIDLNRLLKEDNEHGCQLIFATLLVFVGGCFYCCYYHYQRKKAIQARVDRLNWQVFKSRGLTLHYVFLSAGDQRSNVKEFIQIERPAFSTDSFVISKVMSKEITGPAGQLMSMGLESPKALSPTKGKTPFEKTTPPRRDDDHEDEEVKEKFTTIHDKPLTSPQPHPQSHPKTPTTPTIAPTLTFNTPSAAIVPTSPHIATSPQATPHPTHTTSPQPSHPATSPQPITASSPLLQQEPQEDADIREEEFISKGKDKDDGDKHGRVKDEVKRLSIGGREQQPLMRSSKGRRSGSDVGTKSDLTAVGLMSSDPALQAVEKKWMKLATFKEIATTQANLQKNKIKVTVVDSKEAALVAIKALPIKAASVYLCGSTTLEEIGLTNYLQQFPTAVKKNYKAEAIDAERTGNYAQAAEIRREGLRADYVFTSAPAVTQQGDILICCLSGTRTGAFAGNTKNLVVVVGANKIVDSYDTGLKRMNSYVLPLESARVRIVYKALKLTESAINFSGAIRGQQSDWASTKVHVIIVKQHLGF